MGECFRGVSLLVADEVVLGINFDEINAVISPGRNSDLIVSIQNLDVTRA